MQPTRATFGVMRILALLPAALLLSGCIVAQIADTAVDVATLPVKAVSKGVDLATTSQAETDQKRGRQLREDDERRGREARTMAERCRQGRALQTDICQQPQPR